MKFFTNNYVELGIISVIIIFSSLTAGSSQQPITGSTIIKSSSQDVLNSVRSDCESKISDLNSQLNKTKTFLLECQEGYKELVVNCTISNKKKIDELSKRLDNCYSNVKSKEFQIKNLTNRINSFDEEKDALNKEYLDLAHNFAIKYCCVQRVINPNVKYYFIENNTVFCSETKNSTDYYEFYKNCP